MLAAALGAAALGGILAAPAARADEVYQIDGEVWDHYQKYLDDIRHGLRPGAYAITKDGTGAFYFWCEEQRCMAGKSYSAEAVDRCEADYGTDCVLFAIRDEIKVQYEVRPGAGHKSSNTVNAPDLAPAPTSTIRVSAEVKAEIDRYLRNAGSGGKAWALAIAKDGSEVASAGCPTAGGGGYFGGGGYCDLNKGTAQELAGIEALKRCGGRDDCVLLYTGAQKSPSIEVVAP